MSPPVTTSPELDDDPIIASYNVILKPRLQDGKLIIVLQQPSQHHSHDNPPTPTQVRLKRNTGVVEVDVPTNLNRAYDRRKGQEWGSSLQRSAAARSGGSHGLAGGFSAGPPPSRSQRSEEKQDSLLDWSEAVRTERVLRTKTLGGVAPAQEEATHLVGVFQGNNFHLTPVSAIVNVRPQLHHIDAQAEAERRREAAAAGAEKAPTGPAGGRAIHMTVKTDGKEVTTETMGDRLKAIRNDKWEHLGYIDENQERAWDSYDENLVHKGSEPAPVEEKPEEEKPEEDGEEGADTKTSADKKGKAVMRQDNSDLLVEKMTYLRTKTPKEDDLLYAVSGRERPPAYMDMDVQEIKPDPGRGGVPSNKGTARSRKK